MEIMARIKEQTKALQKVAKVVAALLLLLLVIHTVLDLYMGRQLRLRLEKRRASGHPIAAFQLTPRRVAAGENGVVHLKGTFAILHRYDVLQRFKEILPLADRSYSDWEDTDRKAVQAFLHSRDGAYIIACLEVSSRFSQFDFGVDWSKNTGTLLPHLAPLQACIQLLCIRASFLAGSGDGDKAFDCLKTALRVSICIKDEPSLVSSLVRIACDSLVIRTLTDIVKEHTPGAKHAAELEGLLASPDRKIDSALIIDGETVMFGIVIFNAILEDENFPFGGDVLWSPIIRYFRRPLTKYDYIFFLDASEVGEQYHEKKWFDPLSGQLRQQYTQKTEKIPAYCTVSRMILPALTRFKLNTVKHHASINLTRIALALSVYKGKYGQFPASLEKLVPEFPEVLPLDPFTGKSFAYDRKGKSFLLYSMGPNMKDDGGKPQYTKKPDGHFVHNKEYDLIWGSLK